MQGLRDNLYGGRRSVAGCVDSTLGSVGPYRGGVCDPIPPNMRRLRSVQWFSVRCALRACVTEALRALDSGGSARAVPATRRLLASRPAYRRFPSWQVPCIEIKGSVSQGSTWHETCVSRTTHPSTRVRFTAHIRAPRGVQPRRHRPLVQSRCQRHETPKNKALERFQRRTRLELKT